MDTLLIPAALVLIVTNVSFAALAARNWYRAERAQREVAQLTTQLRGAGYDTGLVVLSPAAEQDSAL